MTVPPQLTLMNTAPICGAFAAMLAAVMAYVESGAPLRKKALRVSRLAKLGQLLLAMERYNRDVILKASMLACPVWCRRVFYELGGWPALYRWQERRKALRARGLNPSYGKHKTTSHDTSKTAEYPKTQRAAREIKTDAANQFCWAQFMREPSGSNPKRLAGMGVSSSRHYDIPPIGIYPREFIEALRPERADNTSAHGTGTAAETKIESGEGPPDDTPNDASSPQRERPNTSDPPS